MKATQNNRTGPRPLSVHISLAAAALSQQSAQNQSEDSPAAPQELPTEIAAMLMGIRAYQMHPYAAHRTVQNIVWQNGTARLLAPALSSKKDGPVMLLVPSMINRSYILDLMPERSMLQFLAQRGIRAYLLDWGESAGDPGQASLGCTITQRLTPAIEFLAQKTAQKIHALGYCMGGTLLAGAAAINPAALQSLTFLAAPWDFHAGTQALLNRVKFWAPTAWPMIDSKSCLPQDWSQILFASLDPALTAQKFSRFAEMDQDSENAKIFIAVEDWLNDGVDLPSALAQEAIRDWFLHNTPACGAWRIGGTAVRPESIDLPSLVIASAKDRLVEKASSEALYQVLSRSEMFDPDCGHIGMIAGRRCTETVWPEIAAWVLRNRA